jgi:acetoin utilization protein AcuB
MEKLAENIMSKGIISVCMSDSVRMAYDVMRTECVRHLPVIDLDGYIVGIISDRDLNRAMTPVSMRDQYLQEEPQFDPTLEVRDFMSWPVCYTNSDAEVQSVAKMMLDEKISAVMIMDPSRNPQGIITTDDMLKLLISLLHKEEAEDKITLNSVIRDYVFRSASA